MSFAWNTGPIPNLEYELDEAKRTKDWFNAMVHSAIQLERFGYIAIREYLESKDIDIEIIDKLLERIQLREIADYLLTMHILDKQEHKVLQKISEERNKFVHRKKGSNYFIGTRANIEYEPLVKAAIRILKEKLNAERIVVFPH
jgi:hypothetical protein